MHSVNTWWNAFRGLCSNYFYSIGPSEYGQILIITFICGYFWLRSANGR